MAAVDEDLDTCTACSARIRWVITIGDRRMPLDPQPHEDGNVVPVVVDGGQRRARVLTGAELPAQVPAYRSHFVTCPNAAEFRRRKIATTPRCHGCGQPLDPVLSRRYPNAWTARWHPTCAPTVVPRPAPAPPGPEQQELTA